LVFAFFLFFINFTVFAQLPAIIDYGQIATRADGLHAMPISRNGHCSLWLWTTNADAGREVSLTNQFFHWPRATFLGDKIAVVDMGGDYAAGRASTWTLDGQKLDELVFGNEWMRWGGSTLMPSGAAVFVNYSHETASVVLDINYRRPPMPPAPGALPSSPWWTKRLTLPPCQGEIPSANVGVAEMDGLVYVFITRDSAGCLMRLRLKEDGTGLVVVDWEPNFIVGDAINGVFDPMAPDGEFPDLCVRPDRFNHRTLAMYQRFVNRFFVCGSAYAHPIVISVYPDLHRELTLLSPYWSERVIYLACFARPDGPYYVQESTDLSICDWKFIFGGPHGAIKPLDIHDHLTSSDDGWVAYRDGVGNFRLEKLPFPPQLTIAKTSILTRAQVLALAKQAADAPDAALFVPPQNISLESDENLPGTLEDSLDLKKWRVNRSVTNWPVIATQTNRQQFFRFRQP
jgi:hypothetical protein